jgi:ankyrin repeat protein
MKAICEDPRLRERKHGTTTAQTAGVSKRYLDIEALFAAEFGEYERFKDLCDCGVHPATMHPGTGQTALHVAAQHGKLAFCYRYITDHARLRDLDAVDFAGNSPLTLACAAGQEHVCKFFLARGAGTRVPLPSAGSLRRSPLHAAAANGHLHICKLLQQHDKINTETTDAMGRTALHLASVGGYIAVARFLIGIGANVNACSFFGMTPLHEAASRGHTDMCLLFADSNAELTKNTAGLYPSDTARANDHTLTARILDPVVWTALCTPDPW